MEKILYNEIGPNGTEYKKGEWETFVEHSDTAIKGFFGPYRFLSNFGAASVFLDGVEYRSVEVAYQAAKWKPEQREFFSTCTELQSIDYNRKNVPDGYSAEDWDSKKVKIMEELLRQKFDPSLNPENHQRLAETGEKYLEERNWWGDLFWGADKEGNGENMLGKILMEVRDKVF